MPFRRPSGRAGTAYYYFMDDFTGSSSYDTRMWSIRLVGAGGTATLAANSYVTLTATANNRSTEIYGGNLCDFSVAKSATTSFRARLGTTTSHAARGGFYAASPAHTTDYIAIGYDSAVGANWLAYCVAGGTGAPVDMGVAANTSFHEFKIVTTSSLVSYYLDGILRTTINTNITALALQPYLYVIRKTGGSNTYICDYVEAFGERE